MALRLRHRGMAVRLIFPAVLSAAACSSADPEQELRKIASWAATAHLVADARLAGSVSAPYATQTLQAAAQQIDERSQSLRTTRLKLPLRNEVLQTTSELRQVVRAMSLAAEHDSATLARQRSALDSLERQVKALRRSMARE
jgi:hypothetical protein